MTTFAEDIEEVAAGEPIEAITVAPFGHHYGPEERERDDKGLPRAVWNTAYPWAALRPFLDYQYDTGYGGMDCHSIVAWTASQVIFVHEYDGSTSVVSAPRNPGDFEPDDSGY